MKIGYKLGAVGEDVARLQRVLLSAGLTVQPRELDDRAFGPSTLAALHDLQRRNGVPVVDEIDARTLAMLLEIEQTTTIDVVGGASAPKPDEHDGRVTGKLVDGDGGPLPDRRVTLFEQFLRSEKHIADGKTDTGGAYEIRYRRTEPVDLVVRAYDDDGAVVASSKVSFAAPAQVEVDFTTAKDGIVRSASRFAALQQRVTAAIHGTPLQDLVENKDKHELRFLAASAGAAFADVAYLFMAHVLGAKEALRDETLFGLFCQGIPASLGAALASLPDAGIDDAFTSQVLEGVLAHSRSALGAALASAVAAGTLPASYADARKLQLDRLDDLRVRSVTSRPYVRGKTPLSDLLAAGNVASSVQSAFAKAFAGAGERPGPTWKTLRADTTLSKADLATLDTTLRVGELLTGNLPLVRDTFQRLSKKTLARVQDLALLDESDWVARITEVDPTAASIPKVLPNDTPAQRITRFARTLAERFAGHYPSVAFLGGLTNAQQTAFTMKDELVSVLTANPSLDLTRTNIDQYALENKVTISTPALDELKTAQRLLRVSPHYKSVEALKGGGYSSAQGIYFKGRDPFLAQMAEPLGSPGLAKMAYARAHMTYAASLALFAQFNMAVQGPGPASAPPATPPPGSLANSPDLQALFGPLDYFACSDCQSIYSPAAYLVDLLQYLKQFQATPLAGAPPAVNSISNARDALLLRRPGIQHIALDCNNTNVTLPYIDLVNEILEAAIAPPSPPPPEPIIIDTTGTSAERRALPQNISQAAYVKTKTSVFPLTLPFDLPFAQTTAFLAAMGTSREAVMRLFAGRSGGPSAVQVACAALSMNPAMQAVVNGTDKDRRWERWGLSSEKDPVGVLDPRTRKTFTPKDWIAALSRVPVLLNRAGLSLQELYQLLEVRWVTQGAVNLQLGTKDGLLSSDTELMTFTGLDGDVLDRANRFLRLLAASGLRMWEVDWALSQAAKGNLDDAFLTRLAGAISVQAQTKLPLQEVLAFWGPLETRDVTNHLGDEDTVVPSTYSSVFANPTMLASWSAVFPAVDSQPSGTFALDGAAILPTQAKSTAPSKPAKPTPAESANLDATAAALGISGDDIAAILAATTPPTANALTLENVNVLFRYARLASALSLTVPDLILWIELTGASPFGGTPADTLEFLRRLAVLQKTGLAVHDLDYLLRDRSASRSALAFTDQDSTALLQTIRDAIAKLTADQRSDPATIATVFVAAIATATNVTANVVSPLLDKTSVLPLAPATIAQLLQNPTVDPSQFPALVSALVAVAKGAALYTELGASEVEFAFVVENAGTFGWLDPSALPSSPTSPYAAFEALLRALELDRRQAARTPKLFDVLGQWTVAGQLPPDVASAIKGTSTVSGLAAALDASVEDFSALAFGVAPPSLSPVTRQGSLSDMAVLSAIADALDVVARYSVRGSTLVTLSTATPDAPAAGAAFGAFQAQYPESAWFGAVQGVEDRLREARRDALVSYLIGPGANLAPMFTFFTADDVFDYFLIDPGMSACALSTRLLQASLAIQQFVQQCFLDLSVQVNVDTTNRAWKEWSWRQQFRLWQANREVFLYPENYVLPELRKDASSFFADLESDLRQTSCDADLAESAYEAYMRKLVEVSHLVVAAHENQTMSDGSVVLHVFAHTRGSPWKWFYRARTTSVPGGLGAWSAWETLPLDIASEQLVPVVWDQRLHLVWPIFKPESEKQRDQDVPDASGGGTQPAPAKFWAIDFAISERSAGKWQAKRVLTEKMFFSKNVPRLSVDLIDRPPIAFTFRAAENPAHDLVLTVYYNFTAGEIGIARIAAGVAAAEAGGNAASPPIAPFTTEVAAGTLSMPEAPMRVVQDPWLLPDATLVDLSQEPTYALVKKGSFSGGLAAPTGYSFSGQDLVHGYYFQPDTGSVPLNVLSQTTAPGSAAPLELLGTVTNPRMVIPQQEAVFDSLDPFFVDDGGGGDPSPRPSRTYLVEPEFYTVSSYPQELDSLTYARQWSTRFAFHSFYHPFARTMLRELEIGGIPQLMSRTLQTAPESVRGWAPKFDFNSIFSPQPPVANPYPGQPGAVDVGEKALDFSAGSTGAFSLYNWEVFYHGPMFVAALLMQNQKYADAMTWLEYVFDPMDMSGLSSPQRFWQTAPFFELKAPDWANQQIQKILSDLARGVADPKTTASLATWMADPFDPHAIASLRIAAYAKAAVMKFLDILIAWGDSLFAAYTAETVSRAEQLYVLASLVLGPKPDAVRLPPESPTQPLTYEQIASSLDQYSNTLVAVENLVVAPTPPQEIIDGTGASPTLPELPGSAKTLFFCIPPNDQLLSYWTTVEDRLYKVRHCLNLQGQAVPLPLYAPPINPLLAAQAAASGQTPGGIAPAAPIYRFATYLQKAVELTNDVRSFGALVLSALEKKDAETLASLRANQELDIQTRMLDIKTQQVTEANDQITALQNQKAVAKIRHDFYSKVAFMNAWETKAMKLQIAAALINGLAIPLDIAASVANALPSFSFGAAGFGGTPQTSMSWGGGNVGSSAEAAASATRAAANLLTESAGMVATLGQYHRRMDEWTLQANVASAEMTQIDSQVTAATDRLAIAKSELAIQNEQIRNAQAVSDFLMNKYTNASLYDWMVTQLTTVCAQAYQLAYGLAQQAQAAYRYELGRSEDTFIQFGYWDGQHRGLTAAESLLFDLRRMEAQYLAQNARELELTKHVSLALTQPMALVQLIETGACQVVLDEALFDADHPGHYFRRLRNVSLTIPCVTGPYTGVNANLTLVGSLTRITSTLPSAGYVPASAKAPPSDATTFRTTAPGATISTSSGQNDAGLFEVNLRDERFLPFEGHGAVSVWALELNPANNAFDVSTITDVVLQVEYTARVGIAESTVLAAIAPPAGVTRTALVSVKSTFPDAFYAFFHPADTAATEQVLTLPITNRVFPYSSSGSPQIHDVNVFFALTDPPAPGTSIAATFGPEGGTANPLVLEASPPPGWTGTPAILDGNAQVTPALAPQSFTLTVPASSVPPALAITAGGQKRLDPAKVQDILLLLTYQT